MSSAENRRDAPRWPATPPKENPAAAAAFCVGMLAGFLLLWFALGALVMMNGGAACFTKDGVSCLDSLSQPAR